MLRRLNVACGNGEAPTAKVPAPPQALISNIKRPKGGAGGFASQRRDQTCEGGWMKKTVTICCPDKPITFYQLHVCYITHHFMALLAIFDHKQRGPDFDLVTAQRGQMGNSRLPLCSLSILQNKRDHFPERTVSLLYVIPKEKKMAGRFLKMCCNSYSS